MANPWDAGSARILSSLGYEVLATTSAGYAFSVGKCDSFAGLGREVDKPVNVVMGLQGPAYSVQELSAVGVRRISVGGSFARAALGALKRAADEVLTKGTFSYAAQAIPHSVVSELMSQDKQHDRQT